MQQQSIRSIHPIGPGRSRMAGTPKPARGLRLAMVVLLVSAAAVLAACAQVSPPGDAGGESAATPPATGAIDLSITLTESPGAAPHQFRLVADGPTPSPVSTLPDPAAALAAVELHGEKMFFPVPDPARACTQQYGGPEVAVVTGSFKGREVKATFKRTDGCEIASWQALAPLFGALGGGTGAI
ncbi:hypothetical protein AAGW05_15265 [Arthrobacter sp. LAPM80]|uniref:hypothetical protein n=1 Tax=Arthrobacter sp. LAPM80 TaxID=3141788 RepID=UPI00398AA1A8